MGTKKSKVDTSALFRGIVGHDESEAPEDEICLDKTGRKNGRGAYICLNQACLEKAKKTKALERSLKTEIPEEIYQTIAEEMI